MSLQLLDTMPKRFLLSLPLAKRWPPMVDKGSMSYRLTVLSRGHLERQASLQEPDLRRCLGHATLHRRSMELAHRDMMQLIESIALEDDEESAFSSDDEAIS